MNAITFDEAAGLKDFNGVTEHLEEVPEQSTGSRAVDVVVAIDRNFFVLFNSRDETKGRFFHIDHLSEIRDVF